MRRLVILVPILALVGGSIGGPLVPQGAASAAGPPVLTRVLQDQDGAALVGETVRLAWDGNTSAAEARVLSTAVTDDEGRLQIDWVPSAEDVRAARVNGNWFNFTLLVGDPENAGVFSFPARWDGARWVADDSERAGTDAARKVVNAPLRIHMSDMSLSEAEYAQKSAAAASRASYSEKMTLVANVPSGADTRTSFTYGEQADSTLEVKKSLGGDNWSSSGSVKVSNTEEAAIHGKVVGATTRQLSVSIKYAKELQCVAGWTCYTLVKAREWTGDAKAPRIKNWPCRHGKKFSVYKKSQFKGVTRATGSNRTYDIGVDVFGVGLWSRSGYSKNVRMHVRFDGLEKVKHNRYCVGGSTGAWTSAKTLYVSTWRA